MSLAKIIITILFSSLICPAINAQNNFDIIPKPLSVSTGSGNFTFQPDIDIITTVAFKDAAVLLNNILP